MNRLAFLFFIPVLLIISSCKKDNGPGGYWKFKGVNYNVSLCLESGGLDAYRDAVVWSYPRLRCEFASGPNGLYNGKALTVERSDSAGGPIFAAVVSVIIGTDTPIRYISTGGNGGNQTVSVSIVNNKLNISGRGIVLANVSNPLDSSVVDFNITNTN